MTVASLGDLAQSFMLRHRNTALKQEMGRLSTELSTGQVADVRQVLAGNSSYLTDIERKLDILSGYAVATTEAAHFSSAMQIALGRFQEIGTDLATSLMVAGMSASSAASAETGSQARGALEALIGTLNTDIAGRRMFGGTATDRPPLADAETLLDALATAIAGATTPATMMSAAETWFDAATGFEATMYLGADSPLAPFALSQSETVTLDTRATDRELRDVLRLTAVAALADDPAFGLDLLAQSQLYGLTGQTLQGAQDDVIAMRARVGTAEARIDQVATRNAAEVTSLGYARTALLAIDPYEAATKLEEVQFQLQSLYSVTVRMSQLSLVNFL